MGIADSITLGEVLGEGASAVTYQAIDAKGRTVCVKQYKTSVQSADKDRIQREVSLLKKLNHPQVTTVFGAYTKEVNGRELLHVVQEFVDGQDLQVWAQSNPLSMVDIRQILADTLGILEYLHSLTPPILHRDIKPSNLMKRLDGRIVLIDFGQAVQDVHRTLGQTIVTGTIGYQAPEQISGNATVKSDVYSLGVVAVELLTGTSAHTMLEGQLLRWERHCRRLPLPVQEWLDGVLHPEPSRRWDASEALHRLKNLGDVFFEPFVDVSQSHGNVVSVSATFLNMLDGAIQDESEKQRQKREAQYRQQVETDRLAEQLRQQEAECTQAEIQLWKEMLGSWEQLLSAIQSKKVSRDKGFEIFRTAFETKVQERFDVRQSGAVDTRLLMLLQYTSVTPSHKVITQYDKWVFDTFLKDTESKRKETALKRVRQRRELAMIAQELNMQSWWSALWNKSTLEQKQFNLDQQIVSLEQQIESLWEQIQQIMLRCILRDRNEKIAQLKTNFEHSLQLQSIETFEMVTVPAGTFMMAGLESVSDASSDGDSRYQVTLTKNFMMGKYPVTQELWESVTGSNPSRFKGVNRPVENVNWFDVVRFCNILSSREGLNLAYIIKGESITCDWSANGYRLPTEAEWEYSARGAESFNCSGGDIVDEVAWYKANSGGQTHPVGQKKSNGFGLYDMSGNVWEWVWDRYHPSYDITSPSENPKGSTSGAYRVKRGGSWYCQNSGVRVSSRSHNRMTDTGESIGFRLCRTL